MQKILKTFLALLILPLGLLAQVTTGTITGTVKDPSGTTLQGATVEAVHEPSGTKYKTVTNKTGKFNLPGLRVGGPYKVTVSYVGFNTENATDVYVQLGEPSVIDFGLSDSKTELKEVTLNTTARKGALISKDVKGASTVINARQISSLPTLNRSLTDVTRLTPQSSGTSFAGQDNRAINLTLDGAIFNNSFGLSALNGGQTNSTPVSLDAIQQIAVNISPYNLRDAGFTGGSINAVTKSGTNTVHGTGFFNFRNESFVGNKAGAGGNQDVTKTAFDVKQYGISFGGPIIKNKLFYFINYEAERRTDPSQWLADTGITTSNAGGNVTRVKEVDLKALSKFLIDTLKYNPGDYQGFSFNTKSDKGVVRLDWNISDKHKLSIRGNFLTSSRDIPVSNSGVRNGNRTGNRAMMFSNSGYEQINNIYGVIAQLNTRINNNISNEFTAGYTINRDSRNIKGSPFPTVDIQDGSSPLTSNNQSFTLMTFGTEPFTPNNKLNTNTWQVSDNLSIYSGKHTYSAGFSFESFEFENGFTPRINGIYTFNSLNDFYTAARAYLANPNLTTSPVKLRGYAATYSNMPNNEVWIATTKARNFGAYVQDDYELASNFNLTYGLRIDIPYIANGGIYNPEVAGMNFVNDKGATTKLDTKEVPPARVMLSPRVGFNYDVNGDKKVQIRGGMGLFTGRPPFVYISNQMGNNGMQNGAVDVTNSTAYPFKTDAPATGFPATVGQPAALYNIATTEKEFKYPKVFRANLAVDQKLGWGIVGGAEVVYTQSINNIYYYNANLKPATRNFAGPDNRLRYDGNTGNANRINSKISDAVVMKSGTYGGGIMTTLKLEKPMKVQGLSWMGAYTFGYTRDYISAGSIAYSSWSGNKSVNGNNDVGIAFSDNDVRNRLIANVNYRKEFKNIGALQVSLFYEGKNWGRFSYWYGSDMNGDGVSGNDLMYIPRNMSEMSFENYVYQENRTNVAVDGSATITVAQQAQAFENYINQDKYLSQHRGEYVQRNGILMPTVNRFDISVVFDKYLMVGKSKHTIQLRADIFNVGNLISSNSGVGYFVNTNTPLSYSTTTAAGVPVFRMNPVNMNGTRTLNYGTYSKGTSITDTWQAQFGIRYIF